MNRLRRAMEGSDDTGPRLTPQAPAAPILLVDDNSAKRLAIRSVLLPLGYTIVEADSGIAALRCVREQDFAVILLDVRMPIMDGIETALLIRKRFESELTPIIFITAHGSDEIVHTDLYASGAVDFMFAPVVPDELRAKVSVFANLFIKAAEFADRAREVQASVDQLRLLTDAAPIGIFQTDSANRYVYTNPHWSEITGVSADEALGGEWHLILGPEDQSALRIESTENALDLPWFSRRFDLVRPDSERQIVLVTSTSIPSSGGGISGWVGTLADVTAEAEAASVLSNARDAATEASRLKSDFLANMSHEIRTPMNGVIGMTDLLLDTGLDALQRDYAQTVRNSGEALLTIIDNILDVSKIEAGKVEVENIDFDVRRVVHDVVNLLAGSAHDKGLELLTVVENLVPSIVTGDPGRVRQVLINFVGNAIKFTSKGEVIIRVTDPASAEPHLVRFDVSDTGDGIEPEKLRLVFEPFVQADTSTSRKYGGTGLGLSISSEFVALMGGDCGVSSTVGLGSNFWFTIAAPGVGAARPDPDPRDARLRNVTALILEKNAAQREVLGEFLHDWEMPTTIVDSREAALRELRQAAERGEPFGIALVDPPLPGDGVALMEGLDDDAAPAQPVVLISAHGEAGDLHKPIHRENLRDSLFQALGLGPAAATPPAVATERPPARQADLGRLLLAEDNPINQKVAMAMLSGAGYVVDLVPNGAAAVEASAARLYDAILMDCHMPELNGYEATAAIRVREGSHRHTPIIAMTAGARDEDRERCLAGGMDDYLAKPVNKDALLEALRQSMNGGSS